MEFFTFDLDYVDRLRNGDIATERHFVAYFEQLLRIKIRSRMLPAHIADDLRQEIFARVMAELHRDREIRQPERFGAFVMSICNNVLREYYRSSSKNHSIAEAEKDIPDKLVDLESMLVTKQSAEQVRRMLDAMPKRDRDLLRATFLEEKDKNTICRELGVDRKYLDLTTRRAKRAFHAKLVPGAEQHTDTKEIPNASELPDAKAASGVTQVPGAERVLIAEQLCSGEQVSSTEQLPCPNPGEPNHITTPPGAVLYSVAEFICSKRTLEEIVTPLLADMQFEHNEAFSAGRKWEATWIRARGFWSFFTALGINRLVGAFVRIFLRLSSR